MAVSFEQLPASVAPVCVRLRDELVAILGDELVSLWVYGSKVYPNPGRHFGDIDTCAILAESPRMTTVRRIRLAHQAIQSQPPGDSLSPQYVVAAEAASPRTPHDALRPFGKSGLSPYERAHWHAGRYVLLHGTPPEQTFPAPVWSELVEALRGELEHVERHVAAGDDDPYETQNTIWQGSRILYGLQTRDVVISKRAAGAWALENLDPKWRDVIHAAGRAYDGEASDIDEALLREAMAPFTAMVRDYWSQSTPEEDRAVSTQPSG